MASLDVFAMPAQGVGFIGDHVYLSSDTGLTWRCNGRSSGGTLVRGVASAAIGQCVCLALPDQGRQPGMVSLGDAHAGIVVGITGVCHQIANRVLRPSGLDVAGVNGYAFTLSIYAKWGRGSWVEWPRCGAGGMRPSGTSPPGSAGRTRTDDLSFEAMTDPQLARRSNARMGSMDDRGSGNGDRLEAAYDRHGYESPQARRAEIESLLDEQLGRDIDDEVRARIVDEHLRFHVQQDRILARLSAADPSLPEPDLAALTEVRVRFFANCDAILGHDRFARLFGADLGSATRELEGMTPTGAR